MSRESNTLRMRRVRAAWRAAELCYMCGLRVEPGFKACETCRMSLRPKRADYQRAYRARQREGAEHAG